MFSFFKKKRVPPPVPTERPLRPSEEQERVTALKEALSLVRVPPGAGPEEVMVALDAFLEGARRKPGASRKQQALTVARWVGTLWGHQVTKARGWEWVHLTDASGSQALAVASPDRAWVARPIRFVQDLLMAGRPGSPRECFQHLRSGTLPRSAPRAYLELLPVPEDSPAITRPRDSAPPSADAAPRSESAVTLSTRKPVGELGAEDFAAFPMWCYALDEEGRPGQDERWVKPLRRRKSIGPDAVDVLVAVELTLADGRTFPGYARVSSDVVSIEPVALFHPEGPLGLPSVCRMPFSPVTEPWAEEARRGEAGLRGALLARLQAREEEVFPLRVRLALPFEGEAAPRGLVVPRLTEI